MGISINHSNGSFLSFPSTRFRQSQRIRRFEKKLRPENQPVVVTLCLALTKKHTDQHSITPSTPETAANSFTTVIIALSLKMANAWQKFVILRAGKIQGVKGPGLFMIIPVLDNVAAVTASSSMRGRGGTSVPTTRCRKAATRQCRLSSLAASRQSAAEHKAPQRRAHPVHDQKSAIFDA
jgi:hypothetical protein